MSPMPSTAWGGLMIRTSRPYASCHQLSKGAETIMASPPQLAMNAPSGPRRPRIETEASRSGAARAKVVQRMRWPQLIPASTPQSWMATWAGVQNVSRPIEMCQEMSQ